MSASRRLPLLLACLALLPACQMANMSDGIFEGHGLPSPKQAVVDASSASDADVRRRSIGLLAGASFGGEDSYLRLYQILLADKDGSVRAAAARALAERGGPANLPALRPLFKDKELLVRLAAAEAFVRISWQKMEDKGAVQGDLIALLADEDVDLRVAATLALAQLADEASFMALVGRLEDPSWSVSARACEGLARLTGQDLGADGRAWGKYLADAKAAGRDPFAGAKPYAWLPYRRRSTAVQWGWWPDSPTEPLAAREGPRRMPSAKVKAEDGKAKANPWEESR